MSVSERSTTQRIEALVHANKVVLFMKGTRNAPQCGFSATVVGLLDQHVPDYTTVDVLADPEIREGVKQYADWPTVPQLYVDGEFVGGCDIVREMDAQGQLVAALGTAVRPAEPPAITISDAAAATFAAALREGDEGDVLRLVVGPAFEHDLALDCEQPGDVRVSVNGVTLLLDRGSARRANGVQIDYVQTPNPGFHIENPNAPPRVRHVSPSDVKLLLASDSRAVLVDVRTQTERELARVEPSLHLTPDAIEAIEALERDTPLVFLCHHGQRSHHAALQFLERGFTRVYNVAGGIDTWSVEVDPSIPRYG